MAQRLTIKPTRRLRYQLIAGLLVIASCSVSAYGLPAQPVSAATPPGSCFAFNSGTGTITNYYDHEANNPSNPACPRDVDIPSAIGGVAVTAIGNYAFSSNQLTSVSIPSSVTSIGEAAFYNNQLTAASISNSVISIGNYAFRSNQLTAVTIPNSVTSIGNSAFANNQLASVTIPNSVTSIGDAAFYSNQLSSVEIKNPAGITSHSSFTRNPITSMTIAGITYTVANPTTDPACFGMSGSTVTDYYEASPVAARDSGVLCGHAVTIPNSVTAIGDSAFYNNQLTSVTIPDSVTTIGDGAFSINQLTSVTIPNSVTSIGEAAFYSNQLTAASIPNSVTSIGNKVFYGNHITTAYIGSGITSLSPNVFGIQVDLAAWGKPGTFNDWDDDYWSGDPALAQAALGAIVFTRVYTSDPTNPNNLSSGVYYEEWTEIDGDDDWDDVVAAGGYIVNPASLTLTYQNAANHSLSTSQRFTGQLADSTYLTNYYLTSSPFFTLAPPADPQNPTPTEQQAIAEAFASYYSLGDSVTITPPAIAGYITPPTQTFVLGAATNEEAYVYAAADNSSSDSASDGSEAGGELAETGANTQLVAAAAVALVGVGAAMLYLRRN